MGLCIRLLDAVQIQVDGHALDSRSLHGRQARLALAYLICHRHRAVPRTELADVLWGEALPRAWDASLSAVVSRLRRTLAGSGTAVVTEGGCYRLTAADGVWIDIEYAVASLNEAEAARGRGDWATAEQQATDGAELARKSFLPGDEGVWIDEQRDALHTGLLRALEVLADSALGRNAPDAAVRQATDLVAADPLRETAHQRLIRAHLAAGDRAAAVDAFGRCRDTLAEQLGVDPSPQTQECYLEALRLQAPDASPLAAPDPAGETAPTPPQRRIVTATALQIDGVEQWATQLQPEEAQLVLAEALTRATTAIEGMGGCPSGSETAGLVVVFGAAGTHEDDPERAVRAALAAVEAVGKYGVEVAAAWGVPALSARAGVQTGEIVLGGSTDSNQSATARAASSLAERCGSGDVLVGTTTRGLVASLFSWSAPAGVAAVTGVRVSSGKVRGLDGQPAELVGRERELAAGQDAVDAVLDGTGGLLVVTGEAGMGKSRLLSELDARLRTAGQGVWLQGTCLSYGDRHPYWPVRELIREWLGTPPDTAQLRVRVTLRRALEHLFGWQALDLHAALAPLLGLPLEPEAAERTAHLHHDALRRASFDAVASVLGRLGDQQPVVVAIDDLHWADADSLELLEHLLSLAERAAVLLVLALRPERDHPSWRVREQVLREYGHLTRELALDALRPGADGDLLDSLVGAGTLPAPARQRVLATAEGNPFYLEELVRELVANGSLTHTDNGWAFSGDPRVKFPDSVGLVIRSRIDRLAAPSQELLTAAAVLGRQFDRDQLAGISQAGAEEIAEHLRTLQRVELLREARRWPVPQYRFQHALIQEAAYRALPGKRRRELHHRAARALEQQPADQVARSHGDLARHWQAAGDARRAIGYHRQAGDAARDAYARDTASTHYAAAVDLARDLPDQVEVRARLELDLGTLCEQAGELDAAVARLQDAADDARSSGDTAVEADALLELSFVCSFSGQTQPAVEHHIDNAVRVAERAGDLPRQVRAFNWRVVLAAHALRLDRGLSLSERALLLAERSGDERVLATALDGRKTVALYLGDIRELLQITDRLDGMLRRHGILERLQYVVLESAIACAATGDWDRALRRADEALAVNRRIGHRSLEPLLLALHAQLQRSRGRLDDALATAHAALALSAEVHGADTGSWFHAWGNASVGTVLLELGASTAALDPLGRGLEAARQHGPRAMELCCSANLAWACWLAGEHDRARELVETAQGLLGRITTPAGTAFLLGTDAYIAVARLRLALGEPEAAEEVLEPVLAAAEKTGWWEPIAQSALWLGQARRALGSNSGCRELATRALEAAERGGLPTCTWQARAALAGCCDTAGAAAHLDMARDVVARTAGAITDPDRRGTYTAACEAQIRALCRVSGR